MSGTTRTRAAVALAWQAGRGMLVGLTVLTVAVAALPVAAAWLTKLALDGVVGRAPLSTLLGLAVGLAVVGVCTAAAPEATRYLRVEVGRRVALASLDRLYRAVGRFVGLGRFEDPAFHDQLRLAQQSSRNAPTDVLNGIIGTSRGVLMIAGFLGSLLAVSPVMAGLVLLAAVPAAVAERVLARLRTGMFWQISPVTRRELFYSVLLSDIRAAKEIRLFGIGPFLQQRMLTERRTADSAQRRIDQRELRIQVLLAILSATVAGVGLVWALYAASQGRLSVGDVSMFVAAVAGVQAGLAQLLGDYALAHQSLLLFDHYLGVVHAGPELPVRRQPVDLPPLAQGIEFRDVWFRYSPDHPWVLRGVSLTVPHGLSLALVGRNGAGKSTLVKLLCRFYDPTLGSIVWDGVDLRDVRPDVLRARVGAVFQDFMQYDLSAAENIGLGDVTFMDDRAQLETAAKVAGVHDTLVQLPNGYDTLLSRLFHGPVDRAARAAGKSPGAATAGRQGAAPAIGSAEPTTTVGVSLSTGQWQRLALARALLRRQPDLLVLDEPSSGLDAAAEHEVHTTLRNHRAGRTSLLISHRLNAVRDADYIAVLVDGRITESGTHADLVAAGGEYAALFAMQAQGYREPLQ